MKWLKVSLAITLLAVVAFASSDFPGKMKQDSKRDAGDQNASMTHPPVVKRNFNPGQIANGKKLFEEFCFMCHGMDGEGDPDWKRPGKDGKQTAPPLNGTGHAWHHPMKVLHDNIKYGSIDRGGSMMGLQGALSDDDITDIIFWFQSKWPDELYDSWYRRDQKSKGKLTADTIKLKPPVGESREESEV